MLDNRSTARVLTWAAIHQQFTDVDNGQRFGGSLFAVSLLSIVLFAAFLARYLVTEIHKKQPNIIVECNQVIIFQGSMPLIRPVRLDLYLEDG